MLTATAGWVDAVGYLTLGGFFLSFMSGNTTQIGVAFGAGTLSLLPLGIVAAFFVGAVSGALLSAISAAHGRAAVLAFVTVLLGASLAALLGREAGTAAMLVLAAAMGAQNAALVEQDGRRLGVTYVTGTLAASARDLALAIRGQMPAWRWTIGFALWLAFLAGAAAGAWAYGRFQILALVVPLGLSAATLAREVLSTPRTRSP